MINRIVKMTFQKSKTEEFANFVSQIHQEIAAFEGCHKVNILRDISDECVFFSYSLWENEACLEQYRHSEFFRKTWTKTKALFSQKPEAWSTEVFL